MADIKIEFIDFMDDKYKFKFIELSKDLYLVKNYQLFYIRKRSDLGYYFGIRISKYDK